jgi:hypothetical protein
MGVTIHRLWLWNLGRASRQVPRSTRYVSRQTLTLGHDLLPTSAMVFGLF